MHCLYANAVVQPSVQHCPCYRAWKTKVHTWCRHCHLCINASMWREKRWLQGLFDPPSYMQVHPGSGNFTFLSIPPVYYNAKKSHTCTYWKWKAHVSSHSSNLLQWPKITCKYILGVEISRFFPFLQYITMPKNRIHVLPGSGKLTLLDSILITMPKNHIHSSTSWEWKVRVSLHSSNTLQYPKTAYMYILEVESSRFFPFLQFITIPNNRIQVHPGSGNFAFLSIPPIHYNAKKITCTMYIL